MRQLHRQVQERLTGRISFIYVQPADGSGERAYEVGDLPENHINILPDSYLSIWSWLGRFNPKVVILAGHRPLILLVGLLWAVLHRRHVAYMSDTNFHDGSQAWEIGVLGRGLVKRIVLGWVDTLLYIGTRNREYYLSELGKKAVRHRFVKLPYPAIIDPDPISIRGRDTDAGGVLKLLYVGRLVEVKAVDNLIAAMSCLSDTVAATTTLTIVGHGSCRDRLQAQCLEAGISHMATFAGAVKSDRINEWFASHDLLILPSHREPWGLVVNEAFGAELPVAAPYWVGAAADLIIDGETGFVMQDNSRETIANVIETAAALGRKGLRQMGQAGRKRLVEEGFHLEASTQALCQFLEGFASLPSHDGASHAM